MVWITRRSTGRGRGNVLPPGAIVLINRFLREALPERKGTAHRYRSWILNHINPRWEAVPLSKVKPRP